MTALAKTETPAAPGHNNPPSTIDFAAELARDVSAFLADHPAIVDDAGARACKLMLDRAKNHAKDMEAERKALADPHYAAWKAVNEQYKPATDLIDKLAKQLEGIGKAWLRAERDRKEADAEAKRKAAEEAARIAREAAERERIAAENASVGDLEADVGAAIVDTAAAERAAALADREARRAERDTDVKLTGGYGRNIGFRSVEVLTVTDPAAALRAIGLTERITEAMLYEARKFRAEWDQLPAGITSHHEER